MRENIPRHIGRYDVVSLLGEGGMARAYLAVRRGPAGFNKLAVIKQILPNLSSNADFIAMFLDEARLAARLHHPNIVQTFDVSKHDGSYLLAMEYLEGQSLSLIYRRIHPSTIPLATHLWVLTQVLAGLHYAHTLCDFDGTPLGVVHRDISPGNVLVTYAGEVKLLDFGVAKASLATATGRTIKGKPGYCAPEQLCAVEPDARADVFSVGVMLWEALAGRRLNRGKNLVEVAKMRLAGTEPKIRDVRPDVDPALADICDRALAVRPDERFASAADFQAVLQRKLRTLPAQGPATLAGLLEKAFAADRQELRKLIENRLSETSGEGGRSPSDMDEDLSTAKHIGRPGLSPSPEAVSLRPRSRKPLIVSVAGVALAAAVAVVLLVRTQSRPKEVPVVPAPSPTAASAAAPAPLPIPPSIPPAALPVPAAQAPVPAAPSDQAAAAEVVSPPVPAQLPSQHKVAGGRRGRAQLAKASSEKWSGPTDAASPASPAPEESAAPSRAVGKRQAAPAEGAAGVAPGTHLVRPSDRGTRNTIDERDPYSP